VMLGEVVTEVFMAGFPVDEKIGFDGCSRGHNRNVYPWRRIGVGEWKN
jgi:hypothetical protein